jgi:hypothetical protein
MKREPTEYELNQAMRCGMGMIAFCRWVWDAFAIIGVVAVLMFIGVCVKAEHKMAQRNAAAARQHIAQHVKSAHHAKPRHAAVEDEYGQDASQ